MEVNSFGCFVLISVYHIEGRTESEGARVWSYENVSVPRKMQERTAGENCIIKSFMTVNFAKYITIILKVNRKINIKC